ncbi:protein spaetzle 3, partial [Apis cerana]|uniref:protein spaetzle 3 n=1 Tax=Apis cerana TaxID=7461 RepID=UPI002B234A3F
SSADPTSGTIDNYKFHEILWTALSVALGVELRGDLVRGVPCIKKNHQLFCPTAGNTYPIERIERFIDENKALMKRMYGDFEMSSGYGSPTRETGHHRTRRRRRKSREAVKHDIPDGGPNFRDELNPEIEANGDSFFANVRKTRNPRQSPGKNHKDSGRIDACESKVEIVTPYWASNSAGKIRAIVNTQHFEQAIHQEVCSKTQTNRCTGDCGCEQKYKWHRLLAYDPDNDCKGIFMDWFLFPSCCVCRCEPIANKFQSSNNRN